MASIKPLESEIVASYKLYLGVYAAYKKARKACRERWAVYNSFTPAEGQISYYLTNPSRNSVLI